MQAPDEVLSALRARGALISTPPSAKAAGALGAARSTEVIARFMTLGGGVCSIARFEGFAPAAENTTEARSERYRRDEGREGADYIDGVIAALQGGSFVAAFGAEALDPKAPRGVRRLVTSIVTAARSLGGRGVIYTEQEGLDPSSFDVEVVSLRASVEPFVREALRSHAEACLLAWPNEREQVLTHARGRVDDGEEIGAGEAIERAIAASTRTVILGDFGSGRSTELARRAAAMAGAYLESRAELPCPLLLPLRGMRPDLGAILREHVPGLSPEAFWLAAELGMVVSIFDGLDELELRPGKAELSAAIKSLTSFADGGRARTVLSLSRSAALDLPLRRLFSGDLAAPLTVVTLRGFGREGAMRLPREGHAPEPTPPQSGRATLPWAEAKADAGARAAAITLDAMERAKTYAIALRDWIRSELSFRAESAPESAPEELVERGLQAARKAARLLFATGAEDASIDAIVALNKDATEGPELVRRVELVELITRAPIFKVSSPASGSKDGARVGFAHRAFLEALVAQEIGARLDEGSADALDLPLLSPSIVGFLAGADGWDRRKKRLRDALQQPYRARVSENALLTIYGAARARSSGEALGKKLSEDLPPKVKLSGAKLAGVHLVWASLPEADLTGAELSLADLSLADLRGARFDRAKADHAIFDGADLEWATCAGADFFGASFVNANVAGLPRREATTEGAVWLAARGDDGALLSPGLAAPPDQAIAWFIESAPHMGQALSVSPDGRWLAVGRGFTVAILDAVTGHVRQILPGGTGCALAVAFSPDGRLLVSAAKDGSIRVWDAQRGALLLDAETEPAWAMTLAFSPDSSTLLSASDSGPVRVWDMPRCELIRAVGGQVSWFYAAAFSPAGDLFAAALANGSVRVWDARSGATVATIAAPIGPYPCLCFSADGALVFTPSSDDRISAWDARRGDLRMVLSAPQARPSSPPRSPEDEPGQHDPQSAKLAPFMAVASSPDGAWISAASSSGVVIWDARREGRATLVEGSRDACSIAFSPSSNELYFTRSDGSIGAASSLSGRLLRRLRKHARTVDSAVFSPSGDTIASASSGGSIRVWDARRGDLLHTLDGPAAMGTSIVFSLSGDTLAVVMADGSVRMWDARRGDLAHTLHEPGHDIVALAFSPDGDSLASGAIDGSIGLWDTAGKGVVRRLQGGQARVSSLAFAPSGHALAAADVEGAIRLWDPRSLAPLGALAGHDDAVHSIAFLPDGEKLASASADGSIRLWDLRTLEATHVVVSRGGPVHSVSFSPEGDKLASAYADGTVRLWDAQQGELLEVLEGHTASVSSASFSLDGEMLVTASADGTVRLWRAADGRCLCLMLAVEAGWITLAGDAPFFIGGGDVSSLLRFTAGSSSMPAALWAPVFRRPDLVAKTLWGETPSAASLGLAKIGACEAALVEARARLGIGQSRREGPTATFAVSKSAAGRPFAVFDDAPRTPSYPRLPMKRALTWLHLADLHCGAAALGEPHRFAQEAVLEAIRRDLADGSLKSPDFIFVTGDVAFRGAASEYDEAKAWLSAVAEAAGSSLDRVRVIPGNHDVDRARTNNKPVARAHSEIRAAPEELDHELADEALRATLADKLAAYSAFVKSALPDHPAPGSNGLDWLERVPAIPGQRGRARVAGLSTVWISDASDGRLHKGQALPFVRNMILGPRQVHEALGDLEDDELLVVLTHHPPEWLHRDSAEELESALSRRTHIHLCSHIHDAPGLPGLKRFGVFGTKVRYAAGSAHGEPAESKKHGYGWGAVRWNGEALLWQAGWAPRTYDEERGQMRPDAARYKLDADGFAWEPLRLHWRSPVAVEVQG